MQVMVLLSPLFLDDAKRSYCIQISRFAQSYQRHLQQQQRLQQRTSHQHITHSVQTPPLHLLHQTDSHHTVHHHDSHHHGSHQYDEMAQEHAIYLQHCDFCLLQVQLALLDGELKQVISRIHIVQTMAQTWVDLSIILTPIAFFSPPAQAPPMSISI